MLCKGSLELFHFTKLKLCICWTTSSHLPLFPLVFVLFVFALSVSLSVAFFQYLFHYSFHAKSRFKQHPVWKSPLIFENNHVCLLWWLLYLGLFYNLVLYFLSSLLFLCFSPLLPSALFIFFTLLVWKLFTLFLLFGVHLYVF